MIAAEDVLAPVIREEIERRTLPVSVERLPIRVSSLGLDIRLRGAALLAFRSMLEDAALLKALGTMSLPAREKRTQSPLQATAPR